MNVTLHMTSECGVASLSNQSVAIKTIGANANLPLVARTLCFWLGKVQVYFEQHTKDIHPCWLSLEQGSETLEKPCPCRVPGGALAQTRS